MARRFVVQRPFIRLIRSPTWIPARSAAEPGSTDTTVPFPSKVTPIGSGKESANNGDDRTRRDITHSTVIAPYFHVRIVLSPSIYACKFRKSRSFPWFQLASLCFNTSCHQTCHLLTRASGSGHNQGGTAQTNCPEAVAAT